MSIDIDKAYKVLQDIVLHTPLEYNMRMSKEYDADIYLKREDLQKVRSYKLRGAYNAIYSLTDEQKKRGVVCASAGNHSQGVAYSCRLLNIKCNIFMPKNAPRQKIDKVLFHGEDWVSLEMYGDTFDEARDRALEYAKEKNLVFIESFDDEKIIAGQGTVGKEIYEKLPDADVILVPVGGGGLISGLLEFYKQINTPIKIIPVETEGCPKLWKALEAGKPVILEKFENFADGTSLKKIGDLNFQLIKGKVQYPILVPEGKVCSAIINAYSRDAIVLEPSGALSITALDFVRDYIKGKKVVCILSGGNNDINRMNEIVERSLIYEGLKHYFFINLFQRPGALKEFIQQVFGPDDDITRFEYLKKSNKEKSPILLGVELKRKSDYKFLIERMKKLNIDYMEINKDMPIYSFII